MKYTKEEIEENRKNFARALGIVKDGDFEKLQKEADEFFTEENNDIRGVGEEMQLNVEEWREGLADVVREELYEELDLMGLEVYIAKNISSEMIEKLCKLYKLDLIEEEKLEEKGLKTMEIHELTKDSAYNKLNDSIVDKIKSRIELIIQKALSDTVEEEIYKQL